MCCFSFSQKADDQTGKYHDVEGKRDTPPPLSGAYTKDWVNDFVVPDEAMMDEGKKSIDFFLKRCSLSQ